MMWFRLASKALARILFWREVAIERTDLRTMSDEKLKDIGISRMEDEREANRHFWDSRPIEGGQISKLHGVFQRGRASNEENWHHNL